MGDNGAVKKQIHLAVEWLQSGNSERQYQAAFLIRIAVANEQRKALAREAGAVGPLVRGYPGKDNGRCYAYGLPA